MTRTLTAGLAFVACLACWSPSALAQEVVITYDLENVRLLPDISHPGAPAQPMTGTFEWSFEPGDFENGTARFLDIYIPWDNPTLEELIITAEPTSIEISLSGNWHDRGVNVTLSLVEPLSSGQPSAIDAANSRFEIEHGITHEGHASGRIVPRGGLRCELISKFKVRCRDGDVIAKVKSSLIEGTLLTLDNDGDLKSMTINRRGKGKVRYRNQSGTHEVSIVECPENSRSVTCP